MRRTIQFLLAGLVGIVVLSSCSALNKYAVSTSDTHICVFDGSERGGQKLKYQIPPGAKSKRLDSNDQEVRIPASNRFYSASSDRNVADPGAPESYTGNAAGGTPVAVEGQVRFRFNLEKACEWFSKHGRRNTSNGVDLGFNVRGDADQGWFRFLNENFGETMKEVVSEVIGKYDPYAMHYNKPTASGEPTRQQLGKELGEAFTVRLRSYLGGDYFCGTTTDVDNKGAENPCPAMRFQVSYAGPGGDSPQIKLENARLEAEIQKTKQVQLVEAEKAKAQLKAAEAETAAQQARINKAECLAMADKGLDCEGHRPPNNYR